ncbi:MAG: hypothetical protein GX256_01295 [Fretibacterium sp.]|nr:hypothetical protein [Fretibacterium sp.]
MNAQKGSFDAEFTQPIIRTGMWTLLLAVPFSFFPALYLWWQYGAIPTVKTILTAWFMIVSIYGVEYFMTPISYFPILGISGTYMAFLSGNIANMRVPCAIVAQQVVGVEPATKEGEIVATLGMAGSIITNLIVVTIAAIGGSYLLSMFPPIILEALNYVLPSIFGGLFAIFAVRHPKYAVFAIAIASILLGVIKVLPVWLVVVLCSFSTIGFALFSSRGKFSDEDNGETA